MALGRVPSVMYSANASTARLRPLRRRGPVPMDEVAIYKVATDEGMDESCMLELG